MSEAVKQILVQVETLNQAEREELLSAVMRAMGPEDTQIEQAWEDERSLRASRIRSGEPVGLPPEEVFANWRHSQT